MSKKIIKEVEQTEEVAEVAVTEEVTAPSFVVRDKNRTITVYNVPENMIDITTQVAFLDMYKHSEPGEYTQGEARVVVETA